jgi:DNA-binding response OmpR family regulator
MVDKDFDFSISILVIDADETSRRLLSETLAALGFRILQSGNLSDSWDIISNQKVDLVMADAAMPDGNGIEFMMRLKTERPRIPVIILTGVTDNAVKEELLNAGADGILGKPFRINLVEELITSTLMKYDQETLSTPASSSKILVVDDDDALLAFLVEAIRILGYNVVACRTVAAAKEIFAKDTFALVISDFMLPDSNGVFLLKELKNENPNLPIVIVTGYPLAYTPFMARTDGIDGYLGKPFRINQLEQVIVSLLYPEKIPKIE